MKSCSFFQPSNCSVNTRSFVSSSLSLIFSLDAGQLERFVELLQIIDQQVGPRPIHRLDLADDPFLEIETTLSPPKYFRDGSLPLELVKNGVTHRALLQVNFAIPASRFEGKASTPLPQTAHLQD